MAKKVYVVYGVGNNDKHEYTYSFCKVFKSEKKADKYYDKMLTKLMGAYEANVITYYNIDWKSQKIH